MNKNNVMNAISLVLLILLVGMVAYQQFELKSLNDKYANLLQEIQSLRAQTEEVFVLTEDNNSREVWRGFNDDGAGESTFVDHRFRMWINDTSGGWALSKTCRGLMPHGWGLRYAPVNEIELTQQNLSDVALDITLKLIDFRNYTATNSSMNVAICLFFESNRAEYQDAAYETEIQFFNYYGDRIHTDDIWNFPLQNDRVTQVKLRENLQKGEIKNYEMNITQYISRMMSVYGLSWIKLKHIEIFTEAYKGYSEFELYDAKITIVKNAAIP